MSSKRAAVRVRVVLRCRILGIDWIEEVRETRPGTAIIVITGKGDIGSLRTKVEKPVNFFSPQGMARGGIR